MIFSNIKEKHEVNKTCSVGPTHLRKYDKSFSILRSFGLLKY